MTLQSRIKSAMNTTGLLFQLHPQYGHWKTTRPGARPGEIVAYVHNPPGGRKSFISVVVHDAGEVDEDGYEWNEDCYELIVSHADGDQEHDIVTDRDEAVERVATYMKRIE